MNVKSFNDNMNELHVRETKRNAIGFAFELLNAQDAVLCSYFAQRSGERNERQIQGENAWYGHHGNLSCGAQGRTRCYPEGTMEEAWGLASPGRREARKTEHSQPQPCLDHRTDREGGEVRITARRRARSRRRGLFVSRDGTKE